MFSALYYIALASAMTFVSTVQGYESLSEKNRVYIEEIYESFLCPFLDVRSQNAREFGVITIESNVNNLRPVPLQFWGQNLSSTVNYYAAIPDFTYQPPILVEDQIKDVFDWFKIHSAVRVTDVYILTYYSPCSRCATILANLSSTYPYINFHIGFMEEDRDNELATGLFPFQSHDNIFINEVRQLCQDDPDAPNCPLVCEPAGKFYHHIKLSSLIFFAHFSIYMLSGYPKDHSNEGIEKL